MAGSLLEGTRRAVVAAEAGCGDAALAVQQARSVAEDQASWAVRMGVTAHHGVMQRVVDALGEAYQLCEAGHADVGAALGVLGQLSDQSGRDDLVDKSGAVAERVGRVLVAVQAAKGKIDNDAANSANLSQDENVMQAVGTAAAATAEAFVKVDAAAKAVEAYQQQLKQTSGN